MIPPKTLRQRVRSPRRRAFSYRGLVVALAAVAAVPTIGFSLLRDFSWNAKGSGPMLYRVERKDFVHEVTERGTIESASNVEVRCLVKSRNNAGTQILYVIPEGTYVTPAPEWTPSRPGEEPPDLLVKLDSSALDSEMTQQEIICANSEATMIQAQNDLYSAEIALQEYVNGTYVESKQQFLANEAVAKENLTRAQEYLNYSNLLYAKGYISNRELQANAFNVEKQQFELDKAQTALEVLDLYTKRKQEKQLQAGIDTAKAKLAAATHSHELDTKQLQEIKDQIANCTIRAPEAGQVVYANETNRRGGDEFIVEEGAQVRERQVLIKLPDPKRMQVTAQVNEAKVALVTPGLPVTVRVDAFAGLELTGVVEKVSKYPARSSFWAASVKEYDTVVRIDGPADGVSDVGVQPTAATGPDAGDQQDNVGSTVNSIEKLRSGMTAEVRIRVEQISSVLQVPVQAVIGHGSQHYCVIPEGEGFVTREVEIGSTNDKVVVITGRIDEGETVVLNAAAYRDQLALPELPAQEIAMADGESLLDVEMPADNAEPAGPSRRAAPSDADALPDAAREGRGGRMPVMGGDGEPAAAEPEDHRGPRGGAPGAGRRPRSEMPDGQRRPPADVGSGEQQ